MPVVEMEGARRIMLGSNNYLGLTGDERVMGGAEDALHRYGTGLTGSRLLNGTMPLHLELERELAEWMGTDDALVFTTGHQANVGALGTILSALRHGDRRLRRSRFDPRRVRFRARSCARSATTASTSSRRCWSALQDDGGGVLVVVDGVFSMEGDVAPLLEIVELCGTMALA